MFADTYHVRIGIRCFVRLVPGTFRDLPYCLVYIVDRFLGILRHLDQFVGRCCQIIRGILDIRHNGAQRLLQFHRDAVDISQFVLSSTLLFIRFCIQFSVHDPAQEMLRLLHGLHHAAG